MIFRFFLHFTLLAATRGAKSLSGILHTTFLKHIFLNLNVSQSDQVQRFLLSVASSTPWSCTFLLYICLSRT